MEPQVYSFLLQHKDFCKLTDPLEDANTQEILISTFSWLSLSEITTLSSRKKKPQKRSFLISRYVIKKVIADKFEINIEDLNIEWNESSEIMQITYLGSVLPVCISLSHCKDKVLVSLLFDSTSAPLGVDVEKINIKRNTKEIADCYFNSEEADQLTLSNEPKPLFYRQWTEKEALIKALPTKLFPRLSNLSRTTLNQFDLLSSFISFEGFQICIVTSSKMAIKPLCIYPTFEQFYDEV